MTNETNEAERLNADRAEAALSAFIHYGDKKDQRHGLAAAMADGECRLTDLLCDLRHLARREDWDFAEAERLAETHFDAEVAEEGEPDQPQKSDRPIEEEIAELAAAVPPEAWARTAPPPNLVTAAKAVLVEADADIYSDADEVVPTLKRLWDALDALRAAVAVEPATAAVPATAPQPDEPFLWLDGDEDEAWSDDKTVRLVRDKIGGPAVYLYGSRAVAPDFVTAARAVLSEAEGDIYRTADEAIPFVKRLRDALGVLKAVVARSEGGAA